MTTPASASQIVRFGVFELDTQAGELRRNGAKVRLEGQPLTILALLLERPGQVVTREEVKEKLWPGDTFVDFEHSINVAVKRLREALQDSATAPRFVETLPRRGYRFIYPVNGAMEQTAAPGAAGTRRSWAAIAVPIVAVLLVAAIAEVAGLRERLMGRPAPGSIKRVAVLPLRTQSPDPELADGFTEMLITELGRFGSPEVLSHQSVLQYAHSDKPLPEIARELKVDAVVEGTVLRSGDRVRVTVNVVTANPERHLIAGSFERDLRDVFAVERDVARAVAQQIRVQVPAGQQRRSNPRPVSAQVAEAVLRGFAYARTGLDSDRPKAADWFAKAIESDPECALGYAYLALLHSQGMVRGEGGRENRRLARQWAEKALQLDESLAEAHTALAWLNLSEWNWEGADREFKRALELNPNFVPARARYAQFLAVMGRADAAVAQAEIVLQLDPVSPDNVAQASWALSVVGRVDQAIAQLRASLDLNPGYPWTHSCLAQAYLQKGMYQEAIEEFQAMLRLMPGSARPPGMLAYAYARAGRRAEAAKIARELDALRARGKWVVPNDMVPAYLAMDRKDEAFAHLELTYQRHGMGLVFVGSEVAYRPLHSDPRLAELARRVGVPVLP